ncbi:hypothetical protein [Pandoraea thiooxydans]|uniref:hypothetical protein n=1 Tax=Pandoraea thiooxydans TaxID=445709 RepID=UPI0012EBC9E3|nr:hypothetical protein [Pandoraea thiooxydans]
MHYSGWRNKACRPFLRRGFPCGWFATNICFAILLIFFISKNFFCHNRLDGKKKFFHFQQQIIARTAIYAKDPRPYTRGCQLNRAVLSQAAVPVQSTTAPATRPVPRDYVFVKV